MQSFPLSKVQSYASSDNQWRNHRGCPGCPDTHQIWISSKDTHHFIVGHPWKKIRLLQNNKKAISNNECAT